MDYIILILILLIVLCINKKVNHKVEKFTQPEIKKETVIQKDIYQIGCNTDDLNWS
mgnify:FL=1